MNEPKKVSEEASDELKNVSQSSKDIEAQLLRFKRMHAKGSLTAVLAAELTETVLPLLLSLSKNVEAHGEMIEEELDDLGEAVEAGGGEGGEGGLAEEDAALFSEVFERFAFYLKASINAPGIPEGVITGLRESAELVLKAQSILEKLSGDEDESEIEDETASEEAESEPEGDTTAAE